MFHILCIGKSRSNLDKVIVRNMQVVDWCLYMDLRTEVYWLCVWASDRLLICPGCQLTSIICIPHKSDQEWGIGKHFFFPSGKKVFSYRTCLQHVSSWEKFILFFFFSDLVLTRKVDICFRTACIYFVEINLFYKFFRLHVLNTIPSWKWISSD